MFIGSAHVFSANFPAELRQISLQYDSIPADIFLVSIKIMLENPHTLPMNTSSKNSYGGKIWDLLHDPQGKS